MSFRISCTRRRLAPAAGTLVLLLVVGGCGGETQEAACEPVEGALPAGTTADGMAGQYKLTLVATSDQERSVEGTLLLREQADSLRAVMGPVGLIDPNTVMPLIGTTDIDVDSVGGIRLGDLMSADPMRPGVVLLQRSNDMTLRFGSDGNERGLQRFDGGFFALFVREVSSEGFAGGWSSGLSPQSGVSGHFCAVRLEEDD